MSKAEARGVQYSVGATGSSGKKGRRGKGQGGDRRHTQAVEGIGACLRALN